jgi:hypothetical protein
MSQIIKLTAGSGPLPPTVVESLTPNFNADGVTAGTPTSGSGHNINVFGINGPFGELITDTINSSSSASGNIEIEDRTFTTSLVVDPSTTPGSRGTYNTIASAMAAATGPAVIFLRPGTYTENITLKAGVALSAYSFFDTSIVGTLSASYSGSVTISNVNLVTNGANIVSMTGANACALQLFNCFLTVSNATGLSLSNSNGSSGLILDQCQGFVSSGFNLFSSSAVNTMLIRDSDLPLGKISGDSSPSASTISAGQLVIINSRLNTPITSSGTGGMQIFNSQIDTSNGNVACLIVGGTNGAFANVSENNVYSSGTASAISVSSTVTLSSIKDIISSSNTNAITGGGTLDFSDLSFMGTSNVINTTTQAPFVASLGAVRVTAPGAYPYTTLPNDYVIIVDTTSARTINLNASPTTGQTYRIKDNTGTANTNNITITPAAGNIDGSATKVINTTFGSVDVVYNGTQWSLL